VRRLRRGHLPRRRPFGLRVLRGGELPGFLFCVWVFFFCLFTLQFQYHPRIATAAAQASCCAAGTYLATIGATALAACLSCDAGSYSAAGAAGCTPCAAGTYRSVAGAASCRAW